MPLKQEIMAHLERTDPLSARIGACNTVLRAQDGKLYGFNTDVAGITGPLEKRMPLAGAKVLVLGAGGAARAAVFGLREKGANVFILNRTAETAQKLARQSGSKTIRKEALAKTSFDAIINATPVGMAGNKTAPLLEARDLNTRLVFDLVYNPLETPLLHLARQLSIPIITGVEMFVHQGARQFEIWTGKPAPEEEMFRVVLHALRQQAEAAAEAVESKPETKPKPSAKTVAKPAAKQKPEAKPKADAKPEARAAAKPKSETKPKPAAKSPAKQAAKKAAKPKPQAKSPAKKSAAKAKK
jgi:3-dehydroquinate dehydratase/shikimate dehydrogenase